MQIHSILMISYVSCCSVVALFFPFLCGTLGYKNLAFTSLHKFVPVGIYEYHIYILERSLTSNVNIGRCRSQGCFDKPYKRQASTFATNVIIQQSYTNKHQKAIKFVTDKPHNATNVIYVCRL